MLKLTLAVVELYVNILSSNGLASTAGRSMWCHIWGVS